MAAKLQLTVELGTKKQAKNRQREFLHSRSAMVGAMSLALKRKSAGGLTKVQAAEVALSLSMTKHSGEFVGLAEREKGNSEVRPVFCFGLREYARQNLARLAARPFALLHPNQFILQGGLPAFDAWMRANLPGTEVVITTDVPSHFLTLDRERLDADGLLPKAVMMSVLYEPMTSAQLFKAKFKESAHVLKPGISSGYLTASGLLNGSGWIDGRGLPPGAAPSTLLAEASLRRLLTAVEGAGEGMVVAAAYGDNIIILLKSVGVKVALITTLYQAALLEFGEAAADILQARTAFSSPLTGARFMKAIWSVHDGQVRKRMIPGRSDDFLYRLAQEAYESKLSVETKVRKIEGWRNAHSYDPMADTVAAKAYAEHGLTPPYQLT